MSAFHVYHTYADLDYLRDYMAGSTYSSDWTADTDVLLRITEQASRIIDDHVGAGTFGPTTETRLYDLGDGALRYDPRQRLRTVGISTTEYRASVVPLDRWLITATTVIAYADTARTTSETLVAGIANDYILEPYNDIPKYRIKLSEETSKSFGAGQQVLSILGSWGWENRSHSNGALDGAVTTSTSTSIVLTLIGTIAAGTTILVDSEQMYVTAVSANNRTLTVIRGVNGTTAATHLTAVVVYHIEYPEDVSAACAEIARTLYRGRDAGVIETIGTGEQRSMNRPRREIQDVLMRLNHYAQHQPAAGLVF